MKLFKFISKILILLILTDFAFAQTIILYDQPNPQAKQISSADLTIGIIPIFTQPNGEWVKVADPRNGNVGWVKASDLKNKNGQGNHVITQKLITNTAPNQNQMMNFGTMKINDKQTQEYINKARAQQQMMQEKFQSIMQDVGDLFKQEMNNLNANFLPIGQPAQPTPNKGSNTGTK